MKKGRLVFIQLAALAGLSMLLLYRAIVGPAPPDGLVVFTDLEPYALRQQAFRLNQPVEMAVLARGAFDHRSEGTDRLAAYGWILNEETREPAWVMNVSSNVSSGERLLATSEDTVQLDAGTYRAYFASYGSQLSDVGRRFRSMPLLQRLVRNDSRWEEEADRWLFVLQPLTGKASDAELVSDNDDKLQAAGVIWSHLETTSEKTLSHLIEVSRPVRVHARATGELWSEGSDYGWIQNVVTGERVWEMTAQNSRPAGGVDENRESDAMLTLDAGIYALAFKTDRTHAYHDWRANPPYDPESWGLQLSVTAPEDRSAVSTFDPWASQDVFVSLAPVRDDMLEVVTFEVMQPTRGVFYAAGEINRSGRYDFGWLERLEGAFTPESLHEERSHEPDDDLTIWAMNYENSAHAGGASKNRQSIAFLDLDPGAYKLSYRTDGSHAYDDWNSEPPQHESRWGVTLFLLGDEPSSAARVLDVFTFDENEQDHDHDIAHAPDAPAAPAQPTIAVAPPPPVDAPAIARFIRLENGAELNHTFQLDSPLTVRLYATGEISQRRNQYDYGYLKNVGTGEVVWEMKWENTAPAGGDEHNRVFDQEILLEAGSYELYFETDGTHAYGDFGDDAPVYPETWGVTIVPVVP